MGALPHYLQRVFTMHVIMLIQPIEHTVPCILDCCVLAWHTPIKGCFFSDTKLAIGPALVRTRSRIWADITFVGAGRENWGSVARARFCGCDSQNLCRWGKDWVSQREHDLHILGHNLCYLRRNLLCIKVNQLANAVAL